MHATQNACHPKCVASPNTYVIVLGKALSDGGNPKLGKNMFARPPAGPVGGWVG